MIFVLYILLFIMAFRLVWLWGFNMGVTEAEEKAKREHAAYVEDQKREYVLHDWDEPAKVVFRPDLDTIMPYKVMRYGAVLNGFHSQTEAEKWMKGKKP